MKYYDILNKLKLEYDNAQDWVLSYHMSYDIPIKLKSEPILGFAIPRRFAYFEEKNPLPVFVKIYYDAGMKELAVKFLHGTTLKIMIFPNKLRSEFDNTQDLGLPYPGDLHILKHLLHVFINICYVKFHHGTTLEGINRVH